MKLCIVGHGKSLEGAGLGEKIDACDAVVRFKKGWQLCLSNQLDYGLRTHFLCASTETPGIFLGAVESGVIYLAYPKKGFYDETAIENAEKASGKRINVPLNISNFWNAQFRELGATHPNMSLGLGSIAMMAHELSPTTILLAGMDTLLNPHEGFSRIDTVPRTGAGPFPAHDWMVERKMLDVLADAYTFDYIDIRHEPHTRDVQRGG